MNEQLICTNYAEVSIGELINKVASLDCEISCSLQGGSFCLVDMGVSPIEFLCQAEDDFLGGGLSAAVNCITNAKRAIVGQVDQILLSFGYESKRWNTEKKLTKLKELGVLAPTVLRKLVDARNLLEHEYKLPSKEQVEDYLDIAAIFVLGAASQFHPFSDEIDISFSDNFVLTGSLEFCIERENGKAKYKAYGYVYDEGLRKSRVGEAVIENNSKLFCALTKACSSLELKYKVQDSIGKLKLKIKSALVGSYNGNV